MTNGSLSERDRLIGYSTDEYFAELNTWLHKQELVEDSKQSNFDKTKSLSDE